MAEHVSYSELSIEKIEPEDALALEIDHQSEDGDVIQEDDEEIVEEVVLESIPIYQLLQSFKVSKKVILKFIGFFLDLNHYLF